MNVLVVHPEGNFSYNANLRGLLELLLEAGHRVTYVAPRRPALHQETFAASLQVVLVDHPQRHGRFLFPDATDAAAAAADLDRWAGHDLVIGVDRGIVEASWVARAAGVPHALLSYEIFFAAETGAAAKAAEIEASRDVAFAVAQDPLRGRKLCLENGVPPRRLLHIPAAGRRFRAPASRPRVLHELLALPSAARTVLYIGSFADWSGAPFLLASTRHWPADWYLMIHERYGPTPATAELIERHAAPQRVRVSTAAFAEPDAVAELVQSADLGAALYTPTYESEWVGQNIQHIGLASGKIATYLQYGVPVATHELGEISDWIRFYGAGQLFSLERPFVPAPPPAAAAEGCRRLFSEHLDLDRFADSWLGAVAGAGRGGAC